MSPSLEIPRAAIGEFCRRWRIVELAIFGSALREDFRPDSDVSFGNLLRRTCTGDFNNGWR